VVLLGISTLVVVVDQMTKFAIQAWMACGDSIPVVQGVFHITYILNAGAAFGILQHKTYFFVGVALVLVAGVIYLYPRIPADQPLLRIGVALLTGGAVGNVIDRFRLGYVVDFFDFRIWPIFNVADICIVIGVGCLIFYLMRMKDDSNETVE
jgi:signal peptidase II